MASDLIGRFFSTKIAQWNHEGGRDWSLKKIVEFREREDAKRIRKYREAKDLAEMVFFGKGNLRREYNLQIVTVTYDENILY